MKNPRWLKTNRGFCSTINRFAAIDSIYQFRSVFKVATAIRLIGRDARLCRKAVD